MDLCYYCGCEIFKGSKQRSQKRPLFTNDHVIPRSRARGSRTVPSCYACNIEKGNLTIEEFRILKAFRFGYIAHVQYAFPGEET